jgi:uncharacterized membrane protein YdjX (TVP38/TMEM64 family)
VGNSNAKVSGTSGPLLNVLRIIALLAVIGLSIYIFTIRAQAEKLASYGYPGIFIISILANATVLLPAPGVAVVFAMGGVFNPFFVGLVAGLGAAVGEISGYVAGFGGQGVVENIRLYNRITLWMQHYGSLTIFLLAAIPNPFFDLAGMAAGALKMPLQKFIFWCVIGKIIKMLIFAYTGAYSLGWLSGLMK